MAESLWNRVPRETTSPSRARVAQGVPALSPAAESPRLSFPPKDDLKAFFKLINYPVLAVWAIVVVINEVSSFGGRCGRPQFTGIFLWGEEFQCLAQPSAV